MQSGWVIGVLFVFLVLAGFAVVLSGILGGDDADIADEGTISTAQIAGSSGGTPTESSSASSTGVTATQVETHMAPTKGPWLGRDYDGNGQDIVCIDCHDPHSQRSAFGQNFVGFRESGTGNNILRETPGGSRTILYDGTGTRGWYIKNSPDSGICETCHSVTTTFTFGDDTDNHFDLTGSGSKRGIRPTPKLRNRRYPSSRAGILDLDDCSHQLD